MAFCLHGTGAGIGYTFGGAATSREREAHRVQGTAKGLFWIAIILAALACGPANSASIDSQAINDAQWSEKKAEPSAINPVMVKLQVLLDRAHFSPGEIDGKSGENVDKAIAAYAAGMAPARG